MIPEFKKLRSSPKLYASPSEVFRYTAKTIEQEAGEDFERFSRASEFKSLRELFSVAVMAFAIAKDRKEDVVWLRPGDDPPDVEWLDTSNLLPGNKIFRVEVMDIIFRDDQSDSVEEHIKRKLKKKRYHQGTWLVCRANGTRTINIATIRANLLRYRPPNISNVWLLIRTRPDQYAFRVLEIYPQTQETTELTETDLMRASAQTPLLELGRKPL